MTNTQLVLILAGVFAVAAIVAGVAMLAGPAWALVAGGVLALVAVVVLYDPSEKRPV